MTPRVRHLFVVSAKAFTAVPVLTIGILLYLNLVDIVIGGILGFLSVFGVGLAWVVAFLVGMLEKTALSLSKARDASLEASRHDLLTGLLNHGAILEEVGLVCGLPGTHAVLMTDVDGLKLINDMHGHFTGDRVIARVAGCLCQDDAVVGRYGGDEFLTILKNSDRRAAERYREKVTRSLSDSAVLDSVTGDRIQIQVSMGIAIFPAEASATADLLALSDEAMYAMKRQRPVSRDTNSQKYALNVTRLVSILGAFAPLLSDGEPLEEKLDSLTHRLLSGTGADCVVVTLLPRKGAPPVVRSALTSSDASYELRMNEYFEAVAYDKQPIWQQMSQSGFSIVIDSIEADDRVERVARELARDAGLQSALLVPLNGPAGIIGAVYVGSCNEASFGPADVEFFSAVADHLVAIAVTSFLVERIREGAARLTEEHEATVMRLAAAAEAHSQAVGPHLSRVRDISELLALELGLSPADAHDVGLAAALHDVGKLYIPEPLLASTGGLTIEERLQLQQHTLLGARFLAGSGTELAAVVARSHHERWDGGGYPDRLRAEEIPQAARITTVADALDSMTHDRSYQSHVGLRAAVEEISDLAGKQFSPRVVEALLSLHERGVLENLLLAESAQTAEAA